jgi:molybdopterin biosynthesis enzyme
VAGVLVDEPFGMQMVGVGEHVGSAGPDEAGAAVVHIGWGVQADPGMPVVVVVPGEEVVAVLSGLVSCAGSSSLVLV